MRRYEMTRIVDGQLHMDWDALALLTSDAMVYKSRQWIKSLHLSRVMAMVDDESVEIEIQTRLRSGNMAYTHLWLFDRATGLYEVSTAIWSRGRQQWVVPNDKSL